jgi:hypothetical protein
MSKERISEDEIEAVKDYQHACEGIWGQGLSQAITFANKQTDELTSLRLWNAAHDAANDAQAAAEARCREVVQPDDDIDHLPFEMGFKGYVTEVIDGPPDPAMHKIWQEWFEAKNKNNENFDAALELAESCMKSEDGELNGLSAETRLRNSRRTPRRVA